MHISSADKKEKPWFLKALKTRRNPFFDKTVRKTGFIHMVREMRLELTRRLPHAPQTCLSTYSSTLACNFHLLSYYTQSCRVCQGGILFLRGSSITFSLALRPDIWYNTICMYTRKAGAEVAEVFSSGRSGLRQLPDA